MKIEEINKKLKNWSKLTPKECYRLEQMKSDVLEVVSEQ